MTETAQGHCKVKGQSAERKAENQPTLRECHISVTECLRARRGKHHGRFGANFCGVGDNVRACRRYRAVGEAGGAKVS